jgi:HSP20 family molecular chaperone IbpA
MRYRHLRLRYTMLYTSQPPRPVGEILWRSERMSAVLAQPQWRPDTDVYETPAAITAMIDVAGVAEEDLEVELYQDALVVEGHRRLPACEGGAVYLAVAIRQGPFRVEIPLLAAINPDEVEARYDHGLLVITLPKARRQEATS